MQGLSSTEALAYQHAHGYNEIAEKKPSLLRKIAKRSFTPISGMLFFAALLSYVSGKSFDGSFILVLLAVNVGITVLQEHKADTAIEKLNEHLAVSVKALRDGKWQMLSARFLVPKDVIELKSGDIVPADAILVRANTVSANEAALTGESLPKDKKEGDTIYSGSFIASGLLSAEISAIGDGTYFGKTLAKVDTTEKRSSLEKEILRISRFLSILSIAAVVFLTVILLSGHAPVIDVLRLDLSLAIAGIPISLPTVMTLIIAFGIIALAKKDVIVRRLSSLEELADTDYLLTDKTGTLTENKITVDDVLTYNGMTGDDARGLAALVAMNEPDALIDQAILAHVKDIPSAKVLSYAPSDSTRKRGTAQIEQGGKVATLSLGAPQMIAGLCALSPEMRAHFDADVEGLAVRGYRTLALARAQGDHEAAMELVALFSLSDILRDDAGEVVRFLNENGIGVSMVTGDNRSIAKEIASKLGIPGTEIITRDELAARIFDAPSADAFRKTGAFAEILPEDKYELIKTAKRFFTVAANGDGVNDLPAVKAANVGFAVKNAVDALKGAADIVLLSDGISVMRDAFIEGRMIFARLYTYSLYRISESFRLIITIALLGLLTGTYPLSPLQLILIALLNDIPMISLATDRVKLANRPSKINVSEQFTMSTLFGLVGVANSMLLFFFATYFLHLPIAVVQTLFFLKLTVSGHLLIYVAHTKERWYRFLPSTTIILATGATQAIATLLALGGFFMPASISWRLALFVWVWSFFFMQVSECVKGLRGSYPNRVAA